jgi:hypothetical protein
MCQLLKKCNIYVEDMQKPKFFSIGYSLCIGSKSKANWAAHEVTVTFKVTVTFGLATTIICSKASLLILLLR